VIKINKIGDNNTELINKNSDEKSALPWNRQAHFVLLQTLQFLELFLKFFDLRTKFSEHRNYWWNIFRSAFESFRFPSFRKSFPCGTNSCSDSLLQFSAIDRYITNFHSRVQIHIILYRSSAMLVVSTDREWR